MIRKPALSVVVVAYDIARELPRTLLSLSGAYQRGIDVDDYEVIVVDNGSPTPVDPAVASRLKGNFRVVRLDDASSSPAAAVNRGLAEARADTIGVLVDGARLVSPGFLQFALAGSRMYDRTGIVTLGWYLGYDFQREALQAGWSNADEDRLLEMIGWPADGYRLFDIATADESSIDAWFSVLFESNGLFLPAATWAELGGFDERFDAPGGGIVNHDTLERAAAIDGLRWVVLLGEATFHQLHGGVATNVSTDDIAIAMESWIEQYQRLRGRRPVPIHLPDPVMLGTIPLAMRPQFAHTLNRSLHAMKLLDAPVPPPVSLPVVHPHADPMASEWANLASIAARCGEEIESMLFARMARMAAPDAFEGGPLLGCVASMQDVDDLPLPRRAQFHLDAAGAYERCGRLDDAEAHYRAALAIEPGHNDAYLGWARVRMPGPGYLEVLRRVHEEFAPPSYLEIGVFAGASLGLVGASSVAVGVDPSPNVSAELRARCQIVEETSDRFFAEHDVHAMFGGDAPSMVFIDGLHHFPTALADFASVEAIADAGTVVVLHDMLPLDEATQRAERVHNFYTGDVWKMLHCLAEARPSLSWFTVRTPPSGLTFVTGLDPTATALRDRYDELVERFGSLEFDEQRPTPGDVVPNDWAVVAERLGAWRAPVHASAPPAASDASDAPAAVEAPAARALSRRVGQLQASDDSGQSAIADLKRRVGETQTALDITTSQLNAVRSTRLYRWTRPLRKVYARVRGREVA